MTKLLLLLAFALSLSAQTTRNVVISWTASVSTGIVGYNVYRALQPANGSPVFAVLNTTPISGLTYTDTSAVVGNTYLYAATTVDVACATVTNATTPCGESGFSTPVTAPIPPKPVAPSGGIIIILQ